MTAQETRQSIQKLLHVAEDGVLGKLSLQALTLLSGLPDDAAWPSDETADTHGAADGMHAVIGSSFADPADVVAFRHCKSEGNSDSFCFKKGDNGVGKWGDDCTEGSGPSVALPPEDWAQFGSEARGKLVMVWLQDSDKSVLAKLKDTMPHRANITNGASIDMNPDTCAALGLHPPVMTHVIWSWA